jgi:hypothetical protein
LQDYFLIDHSLFEVLQSELSVAPSRDSFCVLAGSQGHAQRYGHDKARAKVLSHHPYLERRLAMDFAS